MSDIDITAPSLAELSTHHSEKWRAFAPDVIPLPVAEMDFPVAAPIREFLHSMVEHSDMGYLGAIPELGSAFASFADRRWNWTVDPTHVRVATDVGVGVVEILRVFTNPGDGVLISSPVYQNFYTWINETKVRGIDVPFIHQQSDDVSLAWGIDWQGIEEAYSSGIKIHLLCSPHNPIGRVYTREELRKFVALAVKYNVLIISDEIHSPLTYSEQKFTPFLTLGEKAREVGITVTAASKGWNIAGLKCAIIVTENAQMHQRLDAIAPATHYRASLLGAFATVAAFQEGEPWLNELMTQLDINRKLVFDLVAEKLPKAKTHLPHCSYLAWIDFSAYGIGDDPAGYLLENAKVAFVPGFRFGEKFAGYIRLNFATSPEIITEAINRVAKALH